MLHFVVAHRLRRTCCERYDSILVRIGQEKNKTITPNKPIRKRNHKENMTEESNAWVFDSLIGFLHGPVWNAPLQTFIEEKSLSKIFIVLINYNLFYIRT